MRRDHDAGGDPEVLEPGRIPVADHDAPMDLAVTSDRSVSCDVPSDRPRGIQWRVLIEEKIAAIPLLQRLRRQRDLPHED